MEEKERQQGRNDGKLYNIIYTYKVWLLNHHKNHPYNIFLVFFSFSFFSGRKVYAYMKFLVDKLVVYYANYI